jgi:hypothetical protein
LEKFESPAEEEMRVRAPREWKMIESIYREARLMIKRNEVVSIKSVLFKQDEDTSEEMGE